MTTVTVAAAPAAASVKVPLTYSIRVGANGITLGWSSDRTHCQGRQITAVAAGGFGVAYVTRKAAAIRVPDRTR